MQGPKLFFQSHRRACLGVALLLLLAGGVAALSRHTPAPAVQPAVEIRAAACFAPSWPWPSKLAVAVFLSRSGPAELTGPLQVELLGASGQVLQRVRQPISQKEALAVYHVELKADEGQARALRLRLRFGELRLEAPLSQILLPKGHETTLTSGQEFHAGSEAALRCDVHGVRPSGAPVPLPGAEVEARLLARDGRAHPLAKARTGADGRADLQLPVPDVPGGQYTLEVTTRSALGEEKLARFVTVHAPTKILLVSDRPAYQPGQIMHLRGLVLRPIDFRPIADAELLFEVEDGKGNKVFKRPVRTSKFGVAWADFQLADEVNEGGYHIRAAFASHQAEKTVTVKHYVLPRFKVNVSANKKFYLPRETVKVELQSDYFFGKPVAGATVEVTASTFDVAFREFHKWQGQTDEKGHAKLQLKLPDYFVGQPLQKGNALLKLDVKVTDTADHAEAVARTYTVSAQPIQVSLIAEGGRVVPDMENRVFVAALYPDGTPARCDIRLWLGKKAAGKPLATVQTTAAGLGEFRFTPRANDLRLDQKEQRPLEMLGGTEIAWGPALRLDLTAVAKDAHDSWATAALTLTSHPLGENILLRLNKPVYQMGETMAVDVHTSAGAPTVYLDIVRGGQILLSRWLEVKDGKAAYSFTMPPHLRGSLDVHAYQVLPTGEIIRDSRAVYVRPRKGLKIDVQASKAVYLPGESGRIRFLVTDAAGQPTQAALSVLVVDEAVYALQEMQPGLEKVYYALQEELQKPRAQVLCEPLEKFKELVREPVLAEEKQQVAEVLLTALKVAPPPRWEVNPAGEREWLLQAQIYEIGWALFDYAREGHAFFKQDAQTGRCTFRPGLLEAVVKQGFIYAEMLKGPLDGRLTLEELARLEKGFTAENLARAVTGWHIKQLSDGLARYTDARRARFHAGWSTSKGDMWNLPEAVLNEVVKHSQHIPKHALRDAWGRPLRLLLRDKENGNPSDPPQLRVYEIVSAGPDGRLGTADDVHRATASYWWELGGGWWSAAGDRQQDAGLRHVVSRRVVGQQLLAMRRGFGGFNFGGGGFNFGGSNFGGFNLGRGPNFGGGFCGGFCGRTNFGGGGFSFGGVRFGGNFGGFNFGGFNFGGGGFMGAGFGGGGFNFGGFGGGGFNIGGGFQGAARQPVEIAGMPSLGLLTKSPHPQGNAPGAASPTRLREYFPETLVWQPNLVTDEKGVADLAVNLADSITTWRLSASASSLQGSLGSTQSSLKVFQDFFVEPDLPVHLTQNDEVAFPVAVYNYVKTPQTVKIVLQQEDWFDLLGSEGLSRSLDLKPSEVTAVKFHIRARRIGRQPLTVRAIGSKLSDAVRRMVEVVPNGRKVEQVVSGRLSGRISHVVPIPDEAVPDSAKILVRIYPGVMAQVLDGMEGMLSCPHG
jgi:hypothetical protein